MWKMKRKNNNENEISLPGHAPFTNIVPVAYKQPECLKDYSDKLNSLIEDFLKNGEVDEYCGKFMDPTLDALEKEALADIRMQYERHLYSISEIMAQREGELIKVRENIMIVERKLEETKKRRMHYQKIYECYNYEPDDRTL